jgi:glycosyltransferase involved in cell wall biosynthesis
MMQIQTDIIYYLSSIIIKYLLKFLIIIPAHNEEAHLSFTLDSLQQQSFKDFKVVVVNDGSTDTTPEVIKNLQIQTRV